MNRHPTRMKSTTKIWLGMMVVTLATCSQLDRLTGLDEVNAPVEARTTAAAMCEQFAKRALHDPDSAKFDWDHVQERPGQIYDVKLKLRAKNGFGAVRRTQFACKVKPDASGQKWFLLSLYHDE